MEGLKIFNKMKTIQEHLLDFLENENDENAFTELINTIDEHLQKSQYEIKEFLYIISKISDHHNRKYNFINKIEQILRHYSKEIKQNLTNSSIFNIFKKNKRILLFLLEEQLITLDKYVMSVISKPKYLEMNYYEYFLPEILTYHKKKLETDETAKQLFYQKRKEGENDNPICTIIRNDSISDFISYVNKSNYSLSSIIEQSIFETNKFLLKSKKYYLIEYAAFFGSIQIIKYLFVNKIEFPNFIWFYAIHGKNPELIHLLEDNNIKMDDYSYEDCFLESIKCFHYELDNYFDNKYSISEHFCSLKKYIKYHNYFHLPENGLDSHCYDLIFEDYIYFVKELLEGKDMNKLFDIS